MLMLMLMLVIVIVIVIESDVRERNSELVMARAYLAD